MSKLTTEASVESGRQMRSPEWRSRSGRWAKHSKHLTIANISAEKMTLCAPPVTKCSESISGGRFEEYSRSPLVWQGPSGCGKLSPEEFGVGCRTTSNGSDSLGHFPPRSISGRRISRDPSADFVEYSEQFKETIQREPAGGGARPAGGCCHRFTDSPGGRDSRGRVCPVDRLRPNAVPAVG